MDAVEIETPANCTGKNCGCNRCKEKTFKGSSKEPGMVEMIIFIVHKQLYGYANDYIHCYGH
jgi:hypothetical protein